MLNGGCQFAILRTIFHLRYEETYFYYHLLLSPEILEARNAHVICISISYSFLDYFKTFFTRKSDWLITRKSLFSEIKWTISVDNFCGLYAEGSPL